MDLAGAKACDIVVVPLNRRKCFARGEVGSPAVIDAARLGGRPLGMEYGCREKRPRRRASFVR